MAGCWAGWPETAGAAGVAAGGGGPGGSGGAAGRGVVGGLPAAGGGGDAAAHVSRLRTLLSPDAVLVAQGGGYALAVEPGGWTRRGSSG